MARAVGVRMQGDDYQARWFWLQLCRLLEDRTKVTQVIYETANVKSLDDVAVLYGPGMRDEEGYPLTADYYQVKFHVTAAGACTWCGLMDPAFINASSVSLLQRVKNAQRQYVPTGRGVRFILYSPWSPHPDDPLAEIISLTDGRILWEKLATGGVRSIMGKIRSAWRVHLNLGTDAELQTVLRPLRLRQGPTLEELRLQLNDRLRFAGFVPVEDGILSHPYDEVTRKLLQAGRTAFTRPQIVEVAQQERLWRGHSVPEPDAYRIGIRSFLRWAEHLEDETDTLLDLLSFFHGRVARSSELWRTEIFPALSAFLSQVGQEQRRGHLHLHTHASIAFAAGYCLDSKAGVDVVPVQATVTGREVWRPLQLAPTPAHAEWMFTTEPRPGGGSDVALALAVSHNILSDVRLHVGHALPMVGRIVSCVVEPGPSNTTVADGPHAKRLADQLSAYLKTERASDERQAALHIFAAAPNGLLFFLGQLARSFGSCTVYEYDFERNTPGAYVPTLSFPPSV